MDYVLTKTRSKEVVQAGSFTNTKESELPGRFAASRSGCWTRSRRLPWRYKSARPGAFVEGVPMWPPSMNSFRHGVRISRPPRRPSHFERAVQLAPDFIAPRVWLVAGLAQLGETASVRVHLRELERLALGASPSTARSSNGPRPLPRGSRSEGEPPAGRAGILTHNNVLLYNLGATLYLLGRPTEAVPPIREASNPAGVSHRCTRCGASSRSRAARSRTAGHARGGPQHHSIRVISGRAARGARHFRGGYGRYPTVPGGLPRRIGRCPPRRRNDGNDSHLSGSRASDERRWQNKSARHLLERVAEAERLRALGRGGSRPRTNHKED